MSTGPLFGLFSVEVIKGHSLVIASLGLFVVTVRLMSLTILFVNI